MIWSMRILIFSSTALVLATGVTVAQQLTVDINRISGCGRRRQDRHNRGLRGEGRCVLQSFRDRACPTGERGFHVHEKGDCGPGMKDGKMDAGRAPPAQHFDPEGKKSHKGPKGRRTQR